MKLKKSPFQPNAILWWVAITALAVSGALYYFLGTQAQIDVQLERRHDLIPNMVETAKAYLTHEAGGEGEDHGGARSDRDPVSAQIAS